MGTKIVTHDLYVSRIVQNVLAGPPGPAHDVLLLHVILCRAVLLLESLHGAVAGSKFFCQFVIVELDALLRKHIHPIAQIRHCLLMTGPLRDRTNLLDDLLRGVFAFGVQQ